jgi:cysteine-rich repeat protein
MSRTCLLHALGALGLAVLCTPPALALAECGNGVLDSGETCDDANDDAGDGCGALCTLEPGFACPVAGQACDALICESAKLGNAVLLRGNYIEVGLNPSAAFGAGEPSPAGWHARAGAGNELGLVSDPEATEWTAQHGDFFLPGSAEEGWSLEVNGEIASNNRGAAPDRAGSFGSAECASSGACGARGGASVVWTMTLPFEGVTLSKRYTVVDGGAFVLVDVELENTTDAALSDVYYLRTVDPDNDQTLHGEFETINEILSEPDGDITLAHVRARQDVSGIESAFSILADDARARVSRGGFTNRVPHDVWQGTPTLLHDGAAAGDQAVSIAFKLQLPAHTRSSFRYTYALSADPTGALACVLDQDGDGAIDLEDSYPADPERCGDRDDDGCEDCDSGRSDPLGDGRDDDGDGVCDAGDDDDDGDGVSDSRDEQPLDPSRCRDRDGDGCDDCSITDADGSGGDPDNDGLDADGDGVCDASDDAGSEPPDGMGPDVVIVPFDAGPSEQTESEATIVGAPDQPLDLPSGSRVSFSGGSSCSVALGVGAGSRSALLAALLAAVGIVRRRAGRSR